MVTGHEIIASEVHRHTYKDSDETRSGMKVQITSSEGKL